MDDIMAEINMPLSDAQLKQLETVTRELSPTQLAWLSGYLWAQAKLKDYPINDRVLAISDPNTAIDDPQTDTNSLPVITILSASQTGNARRIAEQLSADMDRNGFDVKLYRAAEYKFKQIIQEKLLIIVISTQGEGEEPEEATALFNYLFSKKAPQLTEMQFAVLALGDSSYEFFCQAGKRIDERLVELGAKRLLARVDADIDFQPTADCWRQAILEFISQHFTLSTKKSNTIEPIAIESSIYTKSQPFRASVIANQKITSRDSDKDVRHIEIDLADSNLRYQPGDAVGVWFRNDPKLINEILTIFSLNELTEVSVNNKTLTLRQALSAHYELTLNTTRITKKYAELSNNQELLALINDPSQFQQFVKTIPPVDMFRRYSTTITAEQLLSLLRPLTPRLYSISSSQDEVGNEVHLTVGVVQYNIDGHSRWGGASGFLASLKEDDQLDIFIEHNDLFRLPVNDATDIIMIGSGTGIAPFRAFLQQRSIQGASGRNWLFFGNQHFISDFLYQIEWQGYHKEGLLTRIDLAWSRDQQQKVYIQDKLLEKGKDVWQWLTQGAAIYVCGDAMGMAKHVEQALHTIITQQGNMSAESADEFLVELRNQQRYQRDIY